MKHELQSLRQFFALFSAPKSPLAGRRVTVRFSPETQVRQKFCFLVVRHSEEWHHSLLKLKGRNASPKRVENWFKILFCPVLTLLCFLPPPRRSGGARRTAGGGCSREAFSFWEGVCICVNVTQLCASAGVTVWRVAGGHVTPQRSRRFPPQPSAASHKASRRTRMEGCLFCWNWRHKHFLVHTRVQVEGRAAPSASSPCVSFRQVVCVGVYQVNGEEPWSCRTCRALHRYILVITALLRKTDQMKTALWRKRFFCFLRENDLGRLLEPGTEQNRRVLPVLPLYTKQSWESNTSHLSSCLNR